MDPQDGNGLPLRSSQGLCYINSDFDSRYFVLTLAPIQPDGTGAPKWKRDEVEPTVRFHSHATFLSLPISQLPTMDPRMEMC